jgi:DNA-directed RNA polymerase specialized sigma24 family protein
MSGEPIVSNLPIAAELRPSDRVAALFDVHYQGIYRLARRLTSTTDDALDLVQETFLRAARAPKSIPFGADREKAWLVRVVVNLRRDQWRKAAVQKRHDESRPELQSAPPRPWTRRDCEDHRVARARHPSAPPPGCCRHARAGWPRRLHNRVTTGY